MVNGLLLSVQVTFAEGQSETFKVSGGLASLVEMRENCMGESALGPSIYSEIYDHFFVT